MGRPRSLPAWRGVLHALALALAFAVRALAAVDKIGVDTTLRFSRFTETTAFQEHTRARVLVVVRDVLLETAVFVPDWAVHLTAVVDNVPGRRRRGRRLSQQISQLRRLLRWSPHPSCPRVDGIDVSVRVEVPSEETGGKVVVALGNTMRCNAASSETTCMSTFNTRLANKGLGTSACLMKEPALVAIKGGEAGRTSSREGRGGVCVGGSCFTELQAALGMIIILGISLMVLAYVGRIVAEWYYGYKIQRSVRLFRLEHARETGFMTYNPAYMTGRDGDDEGMLGGDEDEVSGEGAGAGPAGLGRGRKKGKKRRGIMSGSQAPQPPGGGGAELQEWRHGGLESLDEEVASSSAPSRRPEPRLARPPAVSIAAAEALGGAATHMPKSLRRMSEEQRQRNSGEEYRGPPAGGAPARGGPGEEGGARI